MLRRMLAISVVLIAACLIAATELLGGRADFQRHRESIALVLSVLLLGFGKWRAKRRAGAAGEQPPSDGSNVAVSKSSFLRSPQYWGPMLMLLTGMTYFANPPNLDAISFLKISNFKLASFQSSAPGNDAPANDSPTNAAAVVIVEFPPMKMQGVMAGNRRPSAIINTKIYFIGDQVGEAVVTAIDHRSITLELSGQTKVLTLRN